MVDLEQRGESNVVKAYAQTNIIHKIVYISSLTTARERERGYLLEEDVDEKSWGIIIPAGKKKVANPRIITACLEELENILKVGEVEKNLDNSTDVNYNAHLIHEAEGLEKTKNLQSLDNNEIYGKGVEILRTYGCCYYFTISFSNSAMGAECLWYQSVAGRHESIILDPRTKQYLCGGRGYVKQHQLQIGY